MPSTGEGLRRRIRGVGLPVGVASLVAAAAGLLVQVVAARYLTPAENAAFLAFWSLLFGGYAVLTGLQNETTRAVRFVERHEPTSTGRPRVMLVAIGVGLTAAALVCVAGALWGDRLLQGGSSIELLVVCGAIALVAGHASTVGALAGLGSWGWYSLLAAAEPVVRLILVCLAVLAGLGLEALEVATASAAVTWVVLTLALGPVRRVWSARADTGGVRYVWRIAQALLGSAATAALMVAFPTLVKVTTPAAVYAGAAPLILAVSMTRAPLLIPLNAFQGAMIANVVEHPDRAFRLLARTAAGILGVGIVGAGVAALVGPWLMTLVFGPEYALTPALLATLTFAATLLAILVLSGSIALALDQHASYVTGWYLALVAAVLALLLPLSFETRVVLSLLVAPSAGVAWHASTIALAFRGSR